MRRECVFVMFVCSATAYGALPDMDLCDGGYPVMALTETTDESTETTTKIAEYSCQKYIENDYCADGYVALNLSGFGGAVGDGVCPEFVTGVRVPGVYRLVQINPVTVCENGFFDGTACVPYVADIENCPDGYNNVFSNNSMHVVADGIECSVGTHVVVPYDGSNLSDSSLMSIYEYPYTNEMETKLAVRLCKVGQEMNYLGDCADLCAPTSGGVNMRYLRTSGGLVIPIYATKLTTPSLNFRKANRRCYANLVPEKSNDAINVMYKDNYYHAVK